MNEPKWHPEIAPAPCRGCGDPTWLRRYGEARCQLCVIDPERRSPALASGPQLRLGKSDLARFRAFERKRRREKREERKTA